jgi:hypothetical protein
VVWSTPLPIGHCFGVYARYAWAGAKAGQGDPYQLQKKYKKNNLNACFLDKSFLYFLLIGTLK